jgi:hypothetical protein
MVEDDIKDIVLQMIRESQVYCEGFSKPDFLNFGIIKKNSVYDLGPFMPFRYQ